MLGARQCGWGEGGEGGKSWRKCKGCDFLKQGAGGTAGECFNGAWGRKVKRWNESKAKEIREEKLELVMRGKGRGGLWGEFRGYWRL